MKFVTAERLLSSCDRGEGFYLVAYKDGLPEEIYFTGISGD